MTLKRGLYLVTPDWDDTDHLIAVTQSAILGGAACVQYRHKTASMNLRWQQAQRLLQLCRAHDVALFINDDVELALDLGADGVHIGRDDGDTIALRKKIGAAMLMGVSCYNDFERARAAVAAGASYVAFGAMYPSPTKPLAPAAEFDLIARAKRELGTTVACIGGITADNAQPLIAAEADLLAVISDIYNAPDPQARALRFATLFKTAGAEQH